MSVTATVTPLKKKDRGRPRIYHESTLVDIYCKKCGQYLCSTYAVSKVYCERCKVWTDGPLAHKRKWLIAPGENQ